MTTQNSRTIHCVNLKFLLFVGSVFCVFMMWFVAPGRNPQKVGLMKQMKQLHPSLLAAAALQWRRPGSLPPWRPLWSGAWPRHDGRWHVLGESCMFWCARTCHHFQSTRRLRLSDPIIALIYGKLTNSEVPALIGASTGLYGAYAFPIHIVLPGELWEPWPCSTEI